MKPHWIGGDNHVVQIDEIYIGRRKYGRGRRPARQNCCWYVGGFDTVTNDIFYERVYRRNSATLKKVILSHVRLDSIIYTDSWKVIDKIFEHYTVNHSIQFMNGEVNTQKIESINGALRRHLRRNGTHSGNTELQIKEYVWRK